LIACWIALASIPVLIISIRIYVMVPAAMIEGLGPRQALNRSFYLTRNYWWRTFGLSIVINILNAIVLLGPTSVVLALVSTVEIDAVATAAATGIINLLMGLLFVSVEYIAATLYYFDLRVRKEALDLQMAVEQRYGEMTEQQQPAPYAATAHMAVGPQLEYSDERVTRAGGEQPQL
jgi:hypothetical protein